MNSPPAACALGIPRRASSRTCGVGPRDVRRGGVGYPAGIAGHRHGARAVCGAPSAGAPAGSVVGRVHLEKRRGGAAAPAACRARCAIRRAADRIPRCAAAPDGRNINVFGEERYVRRCSDRDLLVEQPTGGRREGESARTGKECKK